MTLFDHGPERALHFVRAFLVLLALASVLAAFAARPLFAQAYRETVIAIPDVFPDVEARSVLVRTAERDVVLLRDGDDAPEALLMATALLRRLQAELGAPKPGTGQMIPVTGFVVTRQPQAGRRRRLEETIRSLRAQPVSSLGSIGLARWIEYPDR